MMPMPRFASVGVLSALVALGCTATGTPKDVHTTSGIIKGQIASGTDGVSEYLGIPYAKAPVGNLRWAAPEPFTGNSIIKATAFGNSCPATTSFTSASQLQSSPPDLEITPQGVEVMMSLLSQSDVTYGEDCLTLNVWTKPRCGSAKKAVLFWIYGGGFASGSTDNKGYNGKHMADTEDVIVVSANYRTGIFGFPGNPAATANLGLLDQRLAVEWVRDNIEAFGGDPDRITLFGQSAGASSVDYFSYAWTADPIVAGFIAQSGTVFTPDTPSSAESVAETWYNVTAMLGCGDADSDDAGAVLNCMRSVNWQTVQNASLEAAPTGLSGGYGPSVDGTVVFSDYAARSVNGELIKRPLLIGSNDYEAGLFKVLLGLVNESYSEAEWDFLQTTIFTCATAERALASLYNNVPTWRYRYFGNFPNLRLSTVPDSRAWHGIEIPTILGTDLDIQQVVGRTEVQEDIGKYLRGMWAAFAKDPAQGLNNYGLPEYRPLHSTLLQLAYNNKTGPNLAQPSVYDINCTVDSLLMEAVVALGLL